MLNGRANVLTNSEVLVRVPRMKVKRERKKKRKRRNRGRERDGEQRQEGVSTCLANLGW